MLRTLVPRALATLRHAARPIHRLATEPGQLPEFAALEDRVLLNAARGGLALRFNAPVILSCGWKAHPLPPANLA